MTAEHPRSTTDVEVLREELGGMIARASSERLLDIAVQLGVLTAPPIPTSLRCDSVEELEARLDHRRQTLTKSVSREEASAYLGKRFA